MSRRRSSGVCFRLWMRVGASRLVPRAAFPCRRIAYPVRGCFCSTARGGVPQPEGDAEIRERDRPTAAIILSMESFPIRHNMMIAELAPPYREETFLTPAKRRKCLRTRKQLVFRQAKHRMPTFGRIRCHIWSRGYREKADSLRPIRRTNPPDMPTTPTLHRSG